MWGIMKPIQKARCVPTVAKCRTAQDLFKIIQVGFDTLQRSRIQRSQQLVDSLFTICRMYDNFCQHGVIERGHLDTAFHPGLDTRYGWKLCRGEHARRKAENPWLDFRRKRAPEWMRHAA